MHSVEEAAQKLSLDPSQIRRLLAKGEFKGKKLGRDWVVLDLNYKRKKKPKGGESKEMTKTKLARECSLANALFLYPKSCSSANSDTSPDTSHIDILAFCLTP